MTDVRKDHITDDEAALYDRQIRVWGLQAQNTYVARLMLAVADSTGDGMNPIGTV